MHIIPLEKLITKKQQNGCKIKIKKSIDNIFILMYNKGENKNYV